MHSHTGVSAFLDVRWRVGGKEVVNLDRDVEEVTTWRYPPVKFGSTQKTFFWKK